MPVAGKITRLGIKLGIVGGVCYYTTELGLWGDSNQTEYLYKELYKSASPYIKQAPVEVPELPRVADLTRTLSQNWNKGVIASFEFLGDLPTHISDWSATAFDKINELVEDPKPPSS